MDTHVHHRPSVARSNKGDLVRSSEYVPSVSPAMKTIDEAMLKVASSSVAAVLITGDSGCGKRTLALRLHALSPRKHERLDELDCREVTPESFAVRTTANGHGRTGTLLLKDIDQLSTMCQTMLLELLETSNHSMCVVACTCRDLEHEIRAGNFREDLYYRLAGVCLRVPPLRLRKEDIPGLTNFFLAKYTAMFGRPEPSLSEATYRFLCEYEWPKNIAELETAVKTIAAIGDERVAIVALRTGSMNGLHGKDERTSLKAATRAASRVVERELILRVLSRTRWNRKRAAEELQISYKALLYKLKQIGVDEGAAVLRQGEGE